MKCFLSSLALFFIAGAVAAADSARPEWIWHSTERQAGQTARFRKEIIVEFPVTSADFRAVGESASLDIYLDGRLVAEVEPYDPVLEMDVTQHVHSGRHLLAVESTSCEGPSAFYVEFELNYDGGSRSTVATDGTWSASDVETPDWNRAGSSQQHWHSVVSFGAVGRKLLVPGDLRAGITAVDNYEQWRQALGAQPGTDPAAFLVAPGFEIELVRSAAPDEDSWVSLAFDPQGRAVIAKEKKGLLRMTLSADGRRVSDVESINDTLEECRGLLFAFGDLFANANNSKGLYRLQNDGADNFPDAQLLYTSSGGVGHGRNDLALGPDGQIYVIHGDSVDLPGDAIDLTSPYREARRGQRTSEGHVLRVAPDGSQVEVLAAGLRNPFGIDFNPDGEMFTYDADAEYDMGAPWYRPTRVSHLVVGGDYGWRGVTESWPSYYHDHPDNALPNLDIGKGSPTAVKFGTSSRFPQLYRDALFTLDWTYGRILAVHLTPRGSSYLLTAETFLKGRPLNVTDLDFAPDGSMYIVTGGRTTQSALYRIRHVGAMRNDRRLETAQEKSRRRFTAAARGTRRQLESYLESEVDADAFSMVWSHLANADPRIRYAARNVVERQPIATWQQRALREPNRTAALTALMALARSEQSELQVRILERLNQIDLDTANPTDRLAALFTYGLAISPDAGIDARVHGDVLARLESFYPSKSYAENRLLSDLLVRLRSRQVVAKTIDLLRSAADSVEQMQYLYVLRNVDYGWTPSYRRTYFQVLADSYQFLGGAGLPDFLGRIRDESLQSLTSEGREIFQPLLENATAVEDVTIAETRPFVRKWNLDALIDSLPEVAHDARDLERGREVFVAASCRNCHRFAGDGKLVGPDLTSVRSRFNRRDLLEAILVPSKVVPEKYRSWQIVTTDGRVFTGPTAPGGDYRSPELRLLTDPLQPLKVTTIAKSDIELQRTSATSWMPEGLLDVFSKEEILDLLAFMAGERSQ